MLISRAHVSWRRSASPTAANRGTLLASFPGSPSSARTLYSFMRMTLGPESSGSVDNGVGPGTSFHAIEKESGQSI